MPVLCQDDAAEAGEELDPAQREALAWELAARFSQAASELQLLGLCRASKRRSGAAVQRTWFAPEQGWA